MELKLLIWEKTMIMLWAVMGSNNKRLVPRRRYIRDLRCRTTEMMALHSGRCKMMQIKSNQDLKG